MDNMEKQKEYKLDLGDILNDINYAKTGNFINEDNEKHYSPFTVNKCLWGIYDALFYVQELNTCGKISKLEHYKYLLHALPKKKRFAKWIKETKDELIPLIMEYYKGISEMKAKEIRKMLSPENIEFMKEYLNKGGTEKKATKRKKK